MWFFQEVAPRKLDGGCSAEGRGGAVKCECGRRRMGRQADMITLRQQMILLVWVGGWVRAMLFALWDLCKITLHCIPAARAELKAESVFASSLVQDNGWANWVFFAQSTIKETPTRASCWMAAQAEKREREVVKSKRTFGCEEIETTCAAHQRLFLLHSQNSLVNEWMNEWVEGRQRTAYSIVPRRATRLYPQKMRVLVTGAFGEWTSMLDIVCSHAVITIVAQLKKSGVCFWWDWG
jgi:hypothetical protein